MGLFNRPAAVSGPYKDAALNKMYDLLFCDQPELYRPAGNLSYPWNILFSKKIDTEKLLGIAGDKLLESRLRILACNLLLANKSVFPTKELLGVIVEVPLDGGLDTLAAYSDGTIRYINQSGKMIIWDTQTDLSRKLVNDLFAVSADVVSKIGPWDQPRRTAPGKGMIRLTFLVTDGLYFGEGPFEVLEKDQMGGPIINITSQLLAYITEQKNK